MIQSINKSFGMPFHSLEPL